MNLLNRFFWLYWVAVLCVVTVEAQVPAGPKGKFITVNNAKIYYEEHGQGEPLILLHGFGRTLEDWKAYVPEFAKSFRVIAWDMRGHGQSGYPEDTAAYSEVLTVADPEWKEITLEREYFGSRDRADLKAHHSEWTTPRAA